MWYFDFYYFTGWGFLLKTLCNSYFHKYVIYSFITRDLLSNGLSRMLSLNIVSTTKKNYPTIVSHFWASRISTSLLAAAISGQSIWKASKSSGQLRLGLPRKRRPSCGIHLLGIHAGPAGCIRQIWSIQSHCSIMVFFTYVSYMSFITHKTLRPIAFW